MLAPGSSSLKLALFAATQDPHLLCTWSVSEIGSENVRVKYSGRANIDSEPDRINSHVHAFERFLEVLDSDDDNQWKSRQISHICHRVVHGGSYTNPVQIDKSTLDRLTALSDLAPLHNDRALNIISTCHNSLPNARSIAFFDSAFHSSLPLHVYTYPIDLAVARQNNLRKYGFHGLSYAFILRSVAAFFDKPQSQTSLIVLHLGAGASACAIQNGLSIDTSMGLTPLSGLPGATRSGDIDPSLIFHYAAESRNVGRMSHDKTRSMHITEAEKILNTEAGWRSLTGTSDFREIVSSQEPSHRLAVDILVDRICHYIGAYYVQLQGSIDALVFSGGLGENSAYLRQRVVERCKCLGFDSLSHEKNNDLPPDKIVFEIGDAGGKIKVIVCKTNEELEIARQCVMKPEFWK